MDLTCVFFGMIFIIAGALFALGKLHGRLAAWRNMPQSEKDKIKIKPLFRNIGEIIMPRGIIFLAKGLWAEFSSHMFMVTMIAWLIVAGFDVWHISKSKRYRN